ncbi:MAG: carboxymuconolactone decarboxylase family protein [Pseudomonadota bacterium]
MTDFTLYTPENAPGRSGDLLTAAEQEMGFLPNLYAKMAESDAALEAYFRLDDLVDKTGFSPAEKELVLLTASAENGCTYCVAAHSSGARLAKLDKGDIEAVRTGAPIDDARLDALRRFTEAVIAKRGHAGADVAPFLAAGFTKRAVLDVILCVTMKTLSNYANHILETPLDDVLKRTEWHGKESREPVG